MTAALKMWLDDLGPTADPNDPQRLTRPVPEGWVHVRDVAEAQRFALEHRGEIEAMSLDHDLSDRISPCFPCQIEDGGEGCDSCPCHSRPTDGSDFCRWLAETGYWPRTKPVTHSANPEGAKRMQGIIDRYFPVGKELTEPQQSSTVAVNAVPTGGQ